MQDLHSRDREDAFELTDDYEDFFQSLVLKCREIVCDVASEGYAVLAAILGDQIEVE